MTAAEKREKLIRLIESLRAPAGSAPSGAVAIIGLAGRFPGPGASGLLALEDGEPGRENQRALGHFWHNLWAGHDAVTDIPEDRWDWRAHHEA
ncbi:MAG: beta-ketoacyl synthase N-terminal-like domain-containing protein, partial [Verrucomicrobiota bacterium JB022]|nr:beta-ketoacyl synthase N-terminal-like domain-containing protein [Verrucomicrobiota bacterium JB022]